MNTNAVVNLGLIVVMTIGCVTQFGWWPGLAVAAAVYLLMPYHPRAG